MKRHETLAALAAAAGLSLSIPAQASVAPDQTIYARPVAASLASLQAEIATNPDAALSQMITLASAQGHNRGSAANGNNGVRDHGYGIGRGKGQGKGQGHGHHHHHS